MAASSVLGWDILLLASLRHLLLRMFFSHLSIESPDEEEEARGKNTVEVINTRPASPKGNSKTGAGRKPRWVQVPGKAEAGNKQE